MALAAGLAGVAAVPAPAEAAIADVTVRALSYSPRDITITAGDTVRWTQRTAIQHDIIADDGSYISHPNCPPQCMGDGDVYTRVFTTPGFYRYYCDLHGGPGGSGMAGTIRVLPAPGRSVAVRWSADEYARLQQVATYLGQTPEELQRTGLLFIGFLIGLSGDDAPTPAEINPPGTGATVTSQWAADDVPILDRVKAKYVLNDEDTHRLGVYFLSFLVALAGG